MRFKKEILGNIDRSITCLDCPLKTVCIDKSKVLSGPKKGSLIKMSPYIQYTDLNESEQLFT
jgi:hypothetical protein